MNITAVIGLISVFTCVVLAIVIPGGNLTLFINIEAIFIVLLGGFSCIVAGFPSSIIVKIPKYFAVVLRKFHIDYLDLIHTMITLAESARKEGLLSLEDRVEEVDNPLLRKGLQMAIDGIDEEVIRKSMSVDINQMAVRHGTIVGLFETWANLCPSFGMVGTLAGLILMLGNLTDISAVGPGMSAALTTTFYGALTGYGLFTPLSKHLEVLHEEEELGQLIIVEGVLSIVHGESTRLLEDKLLSFLPPAMRKSVRQAE